MKREREEEEVGGAAMSPSLAGGSSAARVSLFGRAMESPSGFPSLRAPSPIVRAMRTRLDPPPPPLAAAPAPPPPPPPPLPQIIPGKRRRGRPRNCDRLPPPPGFLPTPRARAPPPTPAAHGEASCDESFFPLYFCSFKNGGKKKGDLLKFGSSLWTGHGQLGGLQPLVLTIDVGEVCYMLGASPASS